MITAEELGRQVGVSHACDVLTVSRGTLYRRRQPKQKTDGRVPSPRALSTEERDNVRQELYSDGFIDRAPYQVYAALRDEGRYLCSVRTMYRILAQNNTNRERRNQLKRPNYRKPELLATEPNQVCSWDHEAQRP